MAEEITCQNGLLLEADKRTKINISFRQVSHFVNNGNNGFSFFFALTQGYIVNLNIVILVKDIKLEKVAKCSLQNDVSPNNDEQVQGDFNCEVILEKSEYDNVNFNDPESIKISPYNEEIGGISDLENDEASPLATDKAIKEAKDDQENGETLSELAECVDYYLEENKRIIPPAFEVLGLIDEKNCVRKRKLRLRGVFSSPIKKEMHFFLPLSYPSSQIKCKVYETQAREEVEVTCKIQKEFKSTTSFVLEERVLKNKKKEMVFIKSKRFNFFNSPFDCENYNNEKLELANKRMNAKLTFIQMSKIKLVDEQGQFRRLIDRRHYFSFSSRSCYIDQFGRIIPNDVNNQMIT